MNNQWHKRIPYIDYIEWFLHRNQFFTNYLFFPVKLKMEIMERIIYRFILTIVHSFKFKPAQLNFIESHVDSQNHYWHARQVLTWLCVYFKQMCNEFLNGSSLIASRVQLHRIRVFQSCLLMLCLSSVYSFDILINFSTWWRELVTSSLFSLFDALSCFRWTL